MSDSTTDEYKDKIEIHVESGDNAMTWAEPRYNGKEVGRAGEILINPALAEDYSKALIIVNNWRSSHAFPLNSIQSLLRPKAIEVDSKAVVTQRLKRVPSIEKKLRRFSSMQLHRMQDIGGCRAVVQDVEKVYELSRSIFFSGSKNELIKSDDYIESPKESGYRGIHLIYKYCGAKDFIYNRHKVEIQIRSQIQHAWATTVEIAGTFLKEALKSDEGSNEWLLFFKLVSILFSELEGCTPIGLGQKEIESVREEATQLVDKLRVVERLLAFSISVDFLENQNKKSGYFLLILDIEKQKISVTHYPVEKLEDATELYLHIEKSSKGDKNIDAVLVAASSIRSLKKAYPNYFADSSFFIENLQKAMPKS